MENKKETKGTQQKNLGGRKANENDIGGRKTDDMGPQPRNNLFFQVGGHRSPTHQKFLGGVAQQMTWALDP